MTGAHALPRTPDLPGRACSYLARTGELHHAARKAIKRTLTWLRRRWIDRHHAPGWGGPPRWLWLQRDLSPLNRPLVACSAPRYTYAELLDELMP